MDFILDTFRCRLLENPLRGSDQSALNAIANDQLAFSGSGSGLPLLSQRTVARQINLTTTVGSKILSVLEMKRHRRKLGTALSILISGDSSAHVMVVSRWGKEGMARCGWDTGMGRRWQSRYLIRVTTNLGCGRRKFTTQPCCDTIICWVSSPPLAAVVAVPHGAFILSLTFTSRLVDD